MIRKSLIAAGFSILLPFLVSIGSADDSVVNRSTGNSSTNTQIALGRNNASESFPMLNRSKRGWTFRAVTTKELDRLSERDPDLYPVAAMEILARINTRARYHIAEDVKSGRPLRVPDDFTLYKDWSPVPDYIPEAAQIPKLVLIVKDIPFLGWYEHGNLVKDSLICIGKKDSWTRAGTYRILNKDKDHISRSYTNAYGEPAPMPWALRIYEHVWIHAGDIEKGYCSHGCINLPYFPAIELFKWADSSTVVRIIDSMHR
ncbi:MAG: L,D-transpeptidase [Deltaproteobacteria bacterium]|nr:L,D-transpeptidase [Deltaproteobacteria bacterium]